MVDHLSAINLLAEILDFEGEAVWLIGARPGCLAHYSEMPFLKNAFKPRRGIAEGIAGVFALATKTMAKNPAWGRESVPDTPGLVSTQSPIRPGRGHLAWEQ